MHLISSKLALLLLLLVKLEGSCCWQSFKYEKEGYNTTIDLRVRPAIPRHRGGCGRRPAWKKDRLDVRITNGYKARLGEFPSFASLKILTPKNDMLSYCGGTIVHPRVVLTAAHCLGSKGTYFVGTTLKAPEFWHEDKKLKPIRVSHRCRSDKYTKTGQTLRYDYGVLILKEPIKFGPHVQPACLPSSPVGENELGITVGIGFEVNADGRELEVTSLNALPVKRVLGKTRPELVVFEGYSQKYMGSPCPGDSGGPTYVQRRGKQEVVSVVSYGSGICERGVTKLSIQSDIFKELKHVKDLAKTCAAKAGIKNLVI